MARTKKIDGELVATVEIYLGELAVPHLLNPPAQAVGELAKFMPEKWMWSVRATRTHEEPPPPYVRAILDHLLGTMLNEREAEMIIARVRAATRR